MKLLNTAVKKVFRAVGFNISRLHQPPPDPLVYHQVDLVFDVGANIGQYGMRARDAGYRGRIVSFEPLPLAHELLTQVAKADKCWTVHPRAAVGSRPGKTEINISKNSYSSSILPMLATHSSAAPESVYIGKAATDVITLDSVFKIYRPGNERTFLKIDTQGFERVVLEGAERSLPQIIGVQLELSTVPLYENQSLYGHFLDYFEDRGFALWSLIPGFTDPGTGRMLQFDGIFVREGLRT
jgi:FkbM family methyltransferase